MAAEQHGGGEQNKEHGSSDHQSERIGAIILLPLQSRRHPQSTVRAGPFWVAVAVLRFPCQVPTHVLAQVVAQIAAKVVAQALAGGCARIKQQEVLRSP
jgi:hypothetical protein